MHTRARKDVLMFSLQSNPNVHLKVLLELHAKYAVDDANKGMVRVRHGLGCVR